MATKTDLRVVLGVDGERKFTETMKKLEAQQKLIRAETKNASSALSENATAYEKNEVKAKSLTDQIGVQEQKVQTLKEAYERAAQEKGEDAQVTMDLKTKYENAEAVLNNMKSSLEKTNQKLTEHAEKAEKAAKELKDFGTDAEFVGKKMEKAGEKMTKYLTAGILGAGAAATYAAIDYEEAFAGVVKTVDGTETELENLNSEILEMSTNLPTSATEIAGVAEAAGQLGIGVNDIGNFTDVMVKLGMSTNLNAEEAASSLAKFANITKMSAEDYGKLGSVVVDLGNNFATTESDIVEMATRLAATGTITGKTEPQMMAIATALSSVGIEAEAGGSAISKLMKTMDVAVQSHDTASKTIQKTGYSLRDLEMLADQDSKSFKAVAASLGLTSEELKTMMKSEKKLEQFSQVAGMTADQFIQAYGQDSVAALGSFIDGLNDTDRIGKSSVEVLQDMGLTEVRLSNAVLALASSEGILNKAVGTANKAWGENSALQTEVDKRLETTGSKMKLAKNELTKTAIIMGDNFLPVIADLAGKVGELAEKFGALDKDTQKSIAKFALVVAAAGPVTKVFGGLTSGIGKTATNVSKLISVTQKVKAGTYTGPLKNLLSAIIKTKNATGDLTTATSAATGAAGNLAGSSSSLAGLLGSSGPLIIAFVAAAAAAAGLYAAYRKLTEGDRAVTEGVEKMLSGFGKWDETVSNATNLLSGLNQEIFVSSEKSAKISQSLDTVQKDITTIARNASDERRKLTDDEIKRLEDLFGKMQELSTQELQMQQAYQDAAITMAETTNDYSKENCADLIKTAQETKDNVVDLAKQQHAEKLALLKQAYEVEGTMTAEEYEQKKLEAQSDYDLAVQSANEKFAKVNEIVTQGYFEQNIKGNEHLQSIIDLNSQLTANDQQYADEMSRIASDMTLTAEQKTQQQNAAWWNHHWEKSRIQKEMAAAMENLNSDELAAWVEMSANTELYGGQISDENQQIFDDFIGTYDNLPSKAKKKFKETMQGMIDGIKDKSSELYNKAAEIADGFISKIQNKFDIHSPSRVMKKLFGNVVAGGVEGVEDNKKDIFSEAENIADGFLSEIGGLPQDVQACFIAASDKLRALQAQISSAQQVYAACAQRYAQHKAAAVNNVATYNSTYGDTVTFDAIQKIENVTVRNDLDLRKLADQLESITRSAMRGKGKKV